jgi:hypothetical protein
MVSAKRSKEVLRDQLDTVQFVPTMNVGSMAQYSIVTDATLTATTTYTGSVSVLGFSNFNVIMTNTHSANDSGNIAMEFDLYRKGVFRGTLTAGGTVGDSATSSFLIDSDLLAAADIVKYRVSANHSADYNLDLFLAFNPRQSSLGGTAAITILGYDSGTGAIKVIEQDPITAQKVYSVPFSVAAGAAASGTTSEYIDMDGYNSLNFTLTSSGDNMSMTVGVTQTDDGTAASACTYLDVTSEVHTAGLSIFTATTSIRDTTNFFAGYKYVKFSLAQATSAGTSAFKLEATKFWA